MRKNSASEFTFSLIYNTTESIPQMFTSSCMKASYGMIVELFTRYSPKYATV